MGKSAWLAGVAAAALTGGAGLAQEAVSNEEGAETITVTATRTAQSVFEVPATVSVISDVQIEDQLAVDIKDLVRFEPGVSVRSAPARFGAALGTTGRDGNAGFNIRGLEGNRVLIQVDGIRVPDAFSFGAQSVGRGDYVDLDVLQSVEIMRGAGSALYGSDGLAGVVSFITRDPDSIVGEGGGVAGRARVSYASADDSWAESALGALATQDGAFSAMLSYTRRDSTETETQGENFTPNASRTAANPQDIQSNSALGKLVFAPNDAHRMRLTFEYSDREIVSEVLSARSVPRLPPLTPYTTTSQTLDLDALDTLERNRVSFDHRFDGAGGVIDSALWGVYFQTSDSYEFSDEDRAISADRRRINTFDNEVAGFSGQLESDANFLGVTHNFVYGADYSVTTQEGVRDGTIPPVGETYPTRAFPTTDYVLGGLFVQDEIKLFGEALSLFPALRYDTYDLSPEIDPLFVGTAASQRDSRVTPRLGVVYWTTDQVGLFANVAQGFKAPSPSQVNNGFTNVVSNYRSIPNPDLKPETSDTFEAGARVRDLTLLGADMSGQLTGFTGQYEDFIEQVQVGGAFTAVNPAIYQFINLGEVEISGAEARLDAAWNNGFGVIVAASTAEGEQTVNGVTNPLNSIDPWKLVGGVSYRDPRDRFGGQLIATHSAEKELGDVMQNAAGLDCSAPQSTGPTAACLYVPDGFTTLDLTAYWNFGDLATFRIGIFNLTDETYSWWSDVRGLTWSPAATSPLVPPVFDAYTQPGRNASASVSVRF